MWLWLSNERLINLEQVQEISVSDTGILLIKINGEWEEIDVGKERALQLVKNIANRLKRNSMIDFFDLRWEKWW